MPPRRRKPRQRKAIQLLPIPSISEMEEKTSGLDPDIISNLPRNVTDSILTCLPLRDAVRTSILSKQWRYYWINIPKLVFDETMFQVPEEDELLTRYKLVSIIYQVLLIHRGPLLEFSLSYSGLENCPEIDNFIMFLSKNNVKEFNLNVALAEETYKLPSSFFLFQELTHLNLSSCEFTPPPAFKGFHRLISLKIENVDLVSDSFKSFVSNCPQLESLTLINPSRFQCLGISAPNLKYLQLEASFGRFVLYESREEMHKDEENCRLVNFFRGLPALNKLIANYALLEVLTAGGVPMKLPTSVSFKFLKLSTIAFVFLGEVSSLYSLIGSSPSIQRIEIEACPVPRREVDLDPVLEFLESPDCDADIILDELREVRLTRISGVEPELKFIKLLLAKSPVLKTMLIKLELDDAVSKLEVLKKVTRFQRSSRIAEIIYE